MVIRVDVDRNCFADEHPAEQDSSGLRGLPIYRKRLKLPNLGSSTEIVRSPYSFEEATRSGRGLSFRGRKTGRQTFAQGRIAHSRVARLKKSIESKKQVARAWTVDLRRPADALSPKRWNKVTKELIDISLSSAKAKPKTIEVGSKK